MEGGDCRACYPPPTATIQCTSKGIGKTTRFELAYRSEPLGQMTATIDWSPEVNDNTVVQSDCEPSLLKDGRDAFGPFFGLDV